MHGWNVTIHGHQGGLDSIASSITSTYLVTSFCHNGDAIYGRQGIFPDDYLTATLTAQS